MTERLDRSFFDRPALEVARDLLGQTLVRHTDAGERLEGRVVETEAYLGHDDPCCHSYLKKPTAKTRAMFMTPGTAYVYNVYFNYCCFNISCRGDGAVVLIRAVEPLTHLDIMRVHRRKNLKKQGRVIQKHHLANGPSKLCMAFAITKSDFNEADLVEDHQLWLEAGGGVEKEGIISSSRVGLGKQLPEVYRLKPWRFYIRTSPSVGLRDRAAEDMATVVNPVND